MKGKSKDERMLIILEFRSRVCVCSFYYFNVSICLKAFKMQKKG